MIVAIICLITGEATFFALRFGMEPIAVGVKLRFGEIIVKFDAKFGRESAGLVPRFAFDFQTLNVSTKILMLAQSMSKFVESE